MKAVSSIALCLSLVLLWLPRPLLTSAAQPAKETNDHLQAFRKQVEVLKAEADEEETRRQIQLSTQNNVDIKRVAFHKAAHDLALFEQKRDEIEAHTRKLLAIRERQLELTQRDHQQRIATDADLDQAKRQLAFARFLLAKGLGRDKEVVEHLGTVAELWQRESDRIPSRSPYEVNRIRCRVSCGRYLLAKAAGTPDKAVPELRRTVEASDRVWRQMKDLYEKRSVSADDVFFAHSDLLNAEIRLANATKDPKTIGLGLRDLIDLTEAAVRRTIPRDAETRKLQRALIVQLARDHRRLAQFEQAKTLSDDLAVLELDP